ncbi:MAG: TlpA family protein disulfide reductase [Chloroflexi bacterium]|jgi:cytochrome c biogenesis protein CcmG, thiol:disulfide interchange protein DsbE|nr:TlpA family protein disulfide reductase [Chloroflexota bacterium]MBT3669270.1 TlpA family protein disulfide reductase [Chloroflexota bacterium]MBT4003095.1 TlpA family protein disulfide reductase [Chloroflexota bacterium]MBT4305977.1 TlpA family protein disulfide reductase [Chloroflexota bacterium]MBT4532621.1 TlpA family protein disulfide reductase [Chloroflexota bacterium]
MTEDNSILENQEGKPKISFGRILAWVFVLALLGVVYIQLAKSQQGTIEIGAMAPEFTLTSFEGETFDSEQLKGKVVLLNFWASWCKPCELEAADLEAAWKFYEPRGDVIFLGVDWTDTTNEANEYLEKFSITYPNGPDLGTRISQSYRTTGVPETYIIDKEGVLGRVKIGPFQTYQEIISMVDDVLNQ